MMPLRLCFVCLGNICRSPTAHGIMDDLVSKNGLNDKIRVFSAGTAAYHVGEKADPRSRQTAQSHNVPLHSRAEHFNAKDFARFDYVLAMDRSNLEDLQSLTPSPEAHKKTHLFRDFDPTSPKNSDVPDPYYGPGDGFQRVYDMLDAAAKDWIDSWTNESNSDLR